MSILQPLAYRQYVAAKAMSRVIEAIAHHEAGHVIAARRWRLELQYASIAPESVVVLCPSRWPLADAENRVKFYVAGYCAEKRYAPATVDPATSRPDFDNARAICNGDRQRLWRLLRETDFYVRANWGQASLIARALLDRECMSADEIERVVRGPLASCPPFVGRGAVCLIAR